MSQNEEVTLTLGGRTYRMVVPAEQAARLYKVAESVEAVVGELRTTAPDMDRDRLWALAALQLADDLKTVKTEQTTEREMIGKVCHSLAEKIEKMIQS